MYQQKEFFFRLAWCWMLLAFFAIQTPGLSQEPAKEVSRVFQRRDVSGQTVFTVTLRATEKLPPGMLRLLQRTLRIRRAGSDDSSALAFWQDPPAALDPARAEVRVELKSEDPAVDAGDFVWTWPEVFQVSRPGVIELRSDYAGTQVSLRKPGDGIGILRPALDSGPARVRGRILCQGSPLPFVNVVVAGQGGQAGADGRFEIEGPFGGVPGTVFMAYEGQVQLSPAVAAPLQIFDDFHFTRNDHVDQDPTVTGDVADFGDVTSPSDDCVLWRWGTDALQRYFTIMNAVPPAGGLRVKRWSAVFMSAGAAPHTFYDYIVAPTDLAGSGQRGTFFHEFGHSIRHVADGDETHWHWDDVRFIYARKHNGGQVTNKGFVFNEGWGNFWEAILLGSAVAVHSGAPAGADFIDFNEDRIGQRLHAMSQAAPADTAFMVRVLTANPGGIHTLRDFETRYCAMLPAPGNNAFCGGGLPLRADPPSCPPGYNDDGLTCRLINIISKPSYGRGVGTVPDNCGPGRQYDAGLCYPLCPAGYRGIGPVCWQICPAGYSDDGASCRRNASIFGSDNSACPWYDKCGLTFARGCSKCPPGYANDGCTCRRDAHIFFKSTTTRGAGTVPTSCPAGKQYDAGLCYPFCAAGYSGIGPVCWGSCPAGFDDHGATCYQAPNVFSDD
jgi:hypothetical protein